MMFRYMMRQVLLMFLLMASVQIVFSQSLKDVYNLDMKKPEENVRWAWSVSANRTSFVLDSSKTVKGKNALKILSRRRVGDPHEAGFNLMRTIPLPEWADNKIVTVSVKCKNKDMENLKFSVMCMDENENLRFSDSVFVTKSYWKKYSISFTQKNMKAVRISLSAEEKHLREIQTAWVDRVSISIGGKDVSDVAIEDWYPKTSSELNKNYVMPLSFQDAESIQTVFSSNPCPAIIGLGESTHGSQEIKEANYQFMKTLITRFGCKIIVTERVIDLSLLCDLYVRGLLPESYGDQIIEDSKGYFDDYLSFFDFLSWLREYNKTVEVKVRIFGCHNFFDKRTGLFEYFQKVVDRNNLNFLYYLEKIAKGQFKVVRDRVMNDTLLKSEMDVADYGYLLFLLEKDDIKAERKFLDLSYDADKEMWTVVQKVIELYAPHREKIIISAHSAHISKYASFVSASMNKVPLGKYVADKYKEDYLAVSFQLGEGISTQDESNLFGKTMAQMLQHAPINSFENTALRTGVDYFYYSSTQLPKNITHLRILLRGGRYRDPFRFCSIKRYFDGLVFIKESHGLNNVQNYPAFYVNGLIRHKQEKMREELEKQGVKQKGMGDELKL